MRANRASMLRRVRVLVAWAVVLWGTSMAVPPARAEETAQYAPRVVLVQRAGRARPAWRQAAAVAGRSIRAARPGLPARAILPTARPPSGGPRPLYLRHQALLL